MRSIPASQPQAITEVAKPVMACAEINAHFSFCAVMIARVAFIGNASANVASMLTPLIIMLRLL